MVKVIVGMGNPGLLIGSKNRKVVIYMGLNMYLEKKEADQEEVYWRKANAIHKWFVDNVQGGVDNCKQYKVTKEDIQRLLTTVHEVLEDHTKAQGLLPPTQGFFFGSTDIDEWYFEDLQYTADELAVLLKTFDFEKDDLYYYSSW